MTAGLHQRVVTVGETAPQLSVGDKILLGLSEATSVRAAVNWLGASLWETAVDGSPNYGQTGKGFAQRLGASAARASSETIFASSVLAPALHEDPRYYQLGSSYGITRRAAYAISRIAVTRTDEGNSTLNISLLGGNIAGAALTQAYYPANNRGFSEVAKTFGGSMGGSAIGFLIDEFFINTFHFAHRDQR